MLASTSVAQAAPPHHVHAVRHLSIGNRMLNWAETQAGKPYSWGATGPWAYDCSGLVVAAARHDGLRLPRTTYEMIYSHHLIRTWHPRRGDLAFFGPVGDPFHVEFVTAWRNTGFGAHDYGTPVGYGHWGWGWVPTAYYRIR